SEADPAGFRHQAGDHGGQPVASAFALQSEPRKTRQVQNTCGIPYGEAFLADALLPGSVAAESLSRFFGRVVTRLRKPSRALPAIVCVELPTKHRDPVVNRRQL